MKQNSRSTNDPLITLLVDRWKWKEWQVIGFLMAISAAIMLGIGSYASAVYSGPGRRIQSSDNIAFILAWILIFIPLVWSIYLWQLRAVKTLFHKLREEGVFGKPSSDRFQKISDATLAIEKKLSQPWVYFTVLLLIVLFWYYEINFGWPQQFRSNGPQYWWEVRWYRPIHIFAWTLSLYAIFTLAIRQLLIVNGISSIMKRFEISIKVLDPDEAGGLGSMGDFIKTSIFFVIGIGVLAALFAIEVALAGANILERLDVLGLFLIYIVLAPLCLVIPTIQVSNAMVRARQKAIEPIAKKFQETVEEIRNLPLEETSTEVIEKLNKRLEALQKQHVLIIQAFPITPITIRSIRNISFTALLPLVSGIISITLQLLNP